VHVQSWPAIDAAKWRRCRRRENRAGRSQLSFALVIDHLKVLLRRDEVTARSRRVRSESAVVFDLSVHETRGPKFALVRAALLFQQLSGY